MLNSYFKTVAVVTAIALSASGMAVAAPLAPGKPAGVKAAQMEDKGWLILTGLAVAGLAIVIAHSGNGNSVTPTPVTVVSNP